MRSHIKNRSSGEENAVSRENDLTTIIIFKNCEMFRIINSKEKQFTFQDEVLHEINSDGLSTLHLLKSEIMLKQTNK